jgi:pimeloyl-ACP methyl ester carboxylesterase
MNVASSPESRWMTAADGLKLHMRVYGSPTDPGLPVVCLPGLSRNAADFAPLAEALADGAAGRKRHVFALDYRGRGASDRDPDWRNYTIPVENADIIAMLTASEVTEAIFVGTSRGGLHIMTLAANRPSLLRGAVLNDIGPVIEAKGLARIRLYLHHLAAPNSLADSIDYLRKTMSAQFEGLSDADLETYARATFQKPDGSYGLTFDQRLVKPFDAIDLDEPLPATWPLYQALGTIPLLIIRGSNSDILSAETFAEMARQHAACETYIVEGQGHAPLLYDSASIERIAGFIRKIEQS